MEHSKDAVDTEDEAPQVECYLFPHSAFVNSRFARDDFLHIRRGRVELYSGMDSRRAVLQISEIFPDVQPVPVHICSRANWRRSVGGRQVPDEITQYGKAVCSSADLNVFSFDDTQHSAGKRRFPRAIN